MAEKDPLRDHKFRTEGLFVRLSADTSPRKLRVLTTDPVVSTDKFGNTRFAFIVWDHNEEKARILNTTPGLAKQIQAIHQDEDFGANIKKVDVKVTTTGSDLETRHTVTALPKSETLTTEQIKECQEISLEEKVEGGERMSFYNSEEFNKKNKGMSETSLPSDEEVGAQAEDIGEEPINLDDIPF